MCETPGRISLGRGGRRSRRAEATSSSRSRRLAQSTTTQQRHRGRSYSLVTEEDLLGQLAVEHLVRVPQAPGHGVPGERFPVQQRHIGGSVVDGPVRTYITPAAGASVAGLPWRARARNAHHTLSLSLSGGHQSPVGRSPKSRKTESGAEVAYESVVMIWCWTCCVCRSTWRRTNVDDDRTGNAKRIKRSPGLRRRQQITKKPASVHEQRRWRDV